MRQYFTVDEEREFDRLRLLRDMIADQEIQNVPCPLLVSQLSDLDTLLRKMQVSIDKLQELME